MKKAIVQFLSILMSVMTCYFSNAQTPATATFSKGADVSWLPQMEATGYKFYDIDGTQKDCLHCSKTGE